MSANRQTTFRDLENIRHEEGSEAAMESVHELLEDSQELLNESGVPVDTYGETGFVNPDLFKLKGSFRPETSEIGVRNFANTYFLELVLQTEEQTGLELDNTRALANNYQTITVKDGQDETELDVSCLTEKHFEQLSSQITEGLLDYNVFDTLLHELYHRAQHEEAVGKVEHDNRPREVFKDLKDTIEGLEEDGHVGAGFRESWFGREFRYPMTVLWSKKNREERQEFEDFLNDKYCEYTDTKYHESAMDVAAEVRERIIDEIEDQNIGFPMTEGALEGYAHLVTMASKGILNEKQEREEYLEKAEDDYAHSGQELRMVATEAYNRIGNVNDSETEQLNAIWNDMVQHIDQYRESPNSAKS